MANAYCLFPDMTTAQTVIASAGFTPAYEGDIVNFLHADGFGKFWGDEYANPLGCPMTENPENPAGNWIYPEGTDAVYFHCRMPGAAVPSELEPYFFAGVPYETFGDELNTGEPEQES